MEIMVPSVQPVGTVPPIDQQTDPNNLEFHGAFYIRNFDWITGCTVRLNLDARN